MFRICGGKNSYNRFVTFAFVKMVTSSSRLFFARYSCKQMKNNELNWMRAMETSCQSFAVMVLWAKKCMHFSHLNRDRAKQQSYDMLASEQLP